MKFIIDLIEDMRSVVENDTDFSISAMLLKEESEGQFTPAGEAAVARYNIDDKEKKIFFFLSQDQALNANKTLEELNTLSNEAMMYEAVISYSANNQRIDKELIGFGESLEEKKYLLFINA